MSDQNYQDYQDYNTEYQQNNGNDQKKDTLAVVSLVLGIVSLVLCCCSDIFSVPFESAVSSVQSWPKRMASQAWPQPVWSVPLSVWYLASCTQF